MKPEWIVAAVGVCTLLLAALNLYDRWAAGRAKGEGGAASAKVAHQRIDALAKEVADFKTHVAVNYASNQMITQMEQRLVDAINRLGDRLDRAFHPGRE